MNRDEQRGYSRGYSAGRKKANEQRRVEQRQREKDAFWRRAFLAALPVCIEAQGWKRGEVPITSLKDRTRMAADFADEAMKHYR